MPTVVHNNHLAIAASAILAVAAACHAPSAHAQVVPPSEVSFPQTYGEWGARWWQYVFGIPADENPLSDSTGAQCHVGQWGPVFFLVGPTVTGTGTDIRSCGDVPADTGLFFPIINVACAVPDDGNNREDIRNFCKEMLSPVDLKSLSVKIDGKSVPNLKNFRASEFFSFTGAASGVFATGCKNNKKSDCYEGFRETAFSDGYWTMLSPLPLGRHTVRFQAAIPDVFSVDVTYRLMVVPQQEPD